MYSEYLKCSVFLGVKTWKMQVVIEIQKAIFKEFIPNGRYEEILFQNLKSYRLLLLFLSYLQGIWQKWKEYAILNSA